MDGPYPENELNCMFALCEVYFSSCFVVVVETFHTYLYVQRPSIKDIRFFGPISDLPTYPYPILSYCNDYLSIAISDFWKPTYLPKDRISFVEAPFDLNIFLYSVLP